MLRITIPGIEMYNETTQEFVSTKDTVLTLEHSLVSLSKWESKWCKPYLYGEKTDEEVMDYIRCMTITQNVDPAVYSALRRSDIQKIVDYIQAPMTATTFVKKAQGNSGEMVTSEVIYAWMVTLNIPFECQKWHINRLLTLIRVCSDMNQPKKKMPKKAIASQNRAVNEARKAKYGTRG